MQGRAKRVSIYIGEDHRRHGRPLHAALLELLQREGAQGATVLRGVAGFGSHQRMRTAAIVDLSAALPLKIEWIDLPQTVDRLLPVICDMAAEGLVVVEEIDIVQVPRLERKDPLASPVSAVMSKSVTSVRPDTPVGDTALLLLRRGYRCVPVIDENNRPIGIVTDGDLLRRAGLYSRLGLQGELTADQLREQLLLLSETALTAGAIMSGPVIAVREDEPVRSAAARMVEHSLKRLPVINAAGVLVGLVSRLDVLAAIEHHPPGAEERQSAPLRAGHSIVELMERSAPSVSPHAHLEEIVAALEASRQQRVVVTDGEGHVLGILTDGDLLRRSQQRRHPSLLTRLRGLVAGVSASPMPLPDADETAADLMTAPVFTVTDVTAPEAALRLMLQHGIKRLPVVDEEDHLVGLLGRASLLHGLIQEASE